MTTEHTLQQLERNADDNEPIFTLTGLREEMEHPDPNRQERAREAMRWMVLLADLRAKAADVRGGDLLAEFRGAFDRRRLGDDLQSADPMRHDVALRFLVAITAVTADREPEDEAVSFEIEQQVERLYARGRALLAAMDGEAGEPVDPLN